MPTIKADKNTVAEAMANHYQKTVELTGELREQRDRMFLFLLGAIGVATFFSIDPATSQSVFFAWVSQLGEGKGKEIALVLKNGPFLPAVQILLPIVVFYLMSNLYHRTVAVLRYYQYIGTMEREIRNELGLKDEQVSFTREGNFYWMRRPIILGFTKWFYTFLLGFLLLLYMGKSIYDGVQGSSWFIPGIVVLITLATLWYLVEYARASGSLDQASREKKTL